MFDKFGNEIKVNDIVSIGSISGIELAYVIGTYTRDNKLYPIVWYLENDLTQVLDQYTGLPNEYVKYNYEECMMKLPNCIRKNNEIILSNSRYIQ